MKPTPVPGHPEPGTDTMTNGTPAQIPGPRTDYLNDVAYPAHFHRETMPGWLVSAVTALGHEPPALDRPFTWIDVGCGVGLGTLVAAATHPHAHFVGIDISAREIGEATRLAREAGLDNVRFLCLDIRQLRPADRASSLTQAHHTQPPPARSAQTHTTHAHPHRTLPHAAAAHPRPDHGLPPQSAPAPALPASCDFIVCHGLYSWVDDETRQALRQLCRQHLRPGGLAYLAYNSQPGAAAFASAQRFLRLNTSRIDGNSATRVRTGIQTLQQMAAHGAGFFTEHPAALREMQRLDQFDDAYLAHELLNPHWHAQHVSDVIRDMCEDAGCQYLGSATLLDNIDTVSIPANLQALLQQLQQQGASRHELETFRDLARNQNLRRDIYQRCPVPAPSQTGRPTQHPPSHRAAADEQAREPGQCARQGSQPVQHPVQHPDPQPDLNDSPPFALGPEQHRQALLAQRICLMPGMQVPPHTSGQLVLDTRIGPVGLPMSQVQPLLHALGQRPHSYAELARLPAYSPNPGFINQLLQVLAWAGWVHYLPPGTHTAPAPEAERLATVLAEAGHGHWQILGEPGTAIPAGHSHPPSTSRNPPRA